MDGHEWECMNIYDYEGIQTNLREFGIQDQKNLSKFGIRKSPNSKFQDQEFGLRNSKWLLSQANIHRRNFRPEMTLLWESYENTKKTPVKLWENYEDLHFSFFQFFRYKMKPFACFDKENQSISSSKWYFPHQNQMEYNKNEWQINQIILITIPKSNESDNNHNRFLCFLSRRRHHRQGKSINFFFKMILPTSKSNQIQ